MTPQQALEELAIGIQQIAAPLKVHEHYARCVNVLHQAIAPQPTAPHAHDSPSKTHVPPQQETAK